MRHPARLGVLTLAVLTLSGLAGIGRATASPVVTAAPVAPASIGASHRLGAQVPSGIVATPSPRRAARSAAVKVLPASVDLRAFAVTPGNQGAVSSCVPWAIDYALLGWYSRRSGVGGRQFAPMYTYAQINHGADVGSNPIDALNVAVAQGNDTWADYTQGARDWKTLPTLAQRRSAARFKIKGYSTLFAGTNLPGNETALKQALASNQPVAIELAVRTGFDYLAASPAATDTDTTSVSRGHHEVLALGYDAAGLIVENSWGTSWANHGFGRISWAVVRHDVGLANTISGFVTPS